MFPQLFFYTPLPLTKNVIHDILIISFFMRCTMNKVDIFGVKVDNLSMDEAVEKVSSWLMEGGKPKVIYTPNSEIIMAAKKDASFLELLNSADLITPDGIGVVKAGGILGQPIKMRVGGFDLSCRVIEFLNEKGLSLFILGGKPGVAEKAAENLKEKYKNLVIAGTNDGYFKDDEPVIQKIAQAKPDYLMVCLGCPKQEKWIYDNKDKLGAKVLIGAGGSADVFAGTMERAPEFFINHNLEWLYRIVKGKRLKRSLSLFAFAGSVFAERIFHEKNK